MLGLVWNFPPDGGLRLEEFSAMLFPSEIDLSNSMPPTIVVVEDNNVVRGCLEELLNSIPGCECVASFSNREGAVKMIPRLSPDLVRMDIHLPSLSVGEDTSRLKETLPSLPILMLTVYDEEQVFQAFKAGAGEYILQRSSPREEIPVVDSGGESSEAPVLSRREIEVLRRLSTGSSNKEIADQLGITVETVRWHLKQIYQKLHVHRRTEAAVKFMAMQQEPHS
ncbi:MAG: hypothetical protein QOE70_3051 [Chthoniobacter sp.]|jgi:DNA-binding NarL/FixJ family response regulator|nr:hypothetical protein [Chthoniobacter sp.]